MKTQIRFRNEKLPIFFAFFGTRTVQKNLGSDTSRNNVYSNNALSHGHFTVGKAEILSNDLLLMTMIVHGIAKNGWVNDLQF